ncbi:unnamed protein product, partial [Amoebophrya sp. A120]|eukprot:GSA120T00005179001.1
MVAATAAGSSQPNLGDAVVAGALEPILAKPPSLTVSVFVSKFLPIEVYYDEENKAYSIGPGSIMEDASFRSDPQFVTLEDPNEGGNFSCRILRVGRPLVREVTTTGEQTGPITSASGPGTTSTTTTGKKVSEHFRASFSDEEKNTLTSFLSLYGYFPIFLDEEEPGKANMSPNNLGSPSGATSAGLHSTPTNFPAAAGGAGAMSGSSSHLSSVALMQNLVNASTGGHLGPPPYVGLQQPRNYTIGGMSTAEHPLQLPAALDVVQQHQSKQTTTSVLDDVTPSGLGGSQHSHPAAVSFPTGGPTTGGSGGPRTGGTTGAADSNTAAPTVDLKNDRVEKVLFSLFHYILSQDDILTLEQPDWHAYERVQSLYAQQVLALVEEHDIHSVWVHDYPLMMLPLLLKRVKPALFVGFFLHSVFPSSEIYRIFPFRQQLLQGVLASNIIGFFNFQYIRHFQTCCTRILGVPCSRSVVEACRDTLGTETKLAAIPLGVDPENY